MKKLSSTALLLGALARRALDFEINGGDAMYNRLFCVESHELRDRVYDIAHLAAHFCIYFDTEEKFGLTRKGFELASKVYDRMSKNPLTASEQLMLAAILM